MAVRARYTVPELRRWARVCREEGVTVRVGPDGAITLSAEQSANNGLKGDDLDDRLAKFAAS